MRVLYFGNNWVGWQILQWLADLGEDIVGLVIHPMEKRRSGDEIIRASGLDASAIFDGSRINEPEVIEEIRTLKPSIGISAFFGYILSKEILDILPHGCINIHPSLLPYNRGAFPNVWSIIEGTPSGVTIHYIDSGIDTGDIISQKEIPVEPLDTGESLYHKLEQGCLELFKETWPTILKGVAPRFPQVDHKGTYHRACDVQGIDEIDLDRAYKARELIDIIRARSFPPYEGAYFKSGDDKIYMRLQLLKEEDLKRSRGKSHDEG